MALRIKRPRTDAVEDTTLRRKAIEHFTKIFCEKGMVPILGYGKTGHKHTKVYVYDDYVVKVFQDRKLLENETRHINKLRDISCIVNYEMLGDMTIIMEKWDGDVMHLLERGKLNKSIFYDCITFLINALISLHDNKLFYTDIKLENILYRAKTTIIDGKPKTTYSFCLGDIGSICKEGDKKCVITPLDSVSRYIKKSNPNNLLDGIDWDKVKSERFMVLSVTDIVHALTLDVEKLPTIMKEGIKQNDNYEYTLEKLKQEWRDGKEKWMGIQKSKVTTTLANLRF